MRLKISKSKNVTLYYVIKTIYINGKEKTITVEKLGNEDEVLKKSKGKDPKTWAKNYVDNLNKLENENNLKILIEKSTSTLIQKDEQNLFNCGYLFLEKIYYELGLNKICENISEKYKFEYDLNNILSRLLYGRIIFPASKLATKELSKTFIEQPNFELHDIYRALEVISKENEFIQSELYKNSLNISKRNTGVLYYDCTNYFFEIEQENGLKQYGPSKEHRPNPIVQMGLFMDGDGIPLAFSIFNGASNEQPSLKPLEEKIIKNYNFDKFVVCTDSGLGSDDNRQFNDIEGRAFITTQSLKKLKKNERELAMSPNNWKRLSDNKFIKNMEEIFNNPDKYTDEIFYKEQPYESKKVPNQIMIITYSPKYALYQKSIREDQLSRAKKIIESGKKKTERSNPNDPSRFIRKTNCTKDGEMAKETIVEINEEKVLEEALYDGFYAVCTDLLDESVSSILNVSENRWEIEESFRIMKTDFKSRPVHLSREDRIKAHFLTCYLALLVYRLLEKKLKNKYTTFEILQTLRSMKLMSIEGIGYKPAYKRTDITDDLHNTFGFYTDYEILKKNTLKSIIHQTKNK